MFYASQIYIYTRDTWFTVESTAYIFSSEIFHNFQTARKQTAILPAAAEFRTRDIRITRSMLYTYTELHGLDGLKTGNNEL